MLRLRDRHVTLENNIKSVTAMWRLVATLLLLSDMVQAMVPCTEARVRCAYRDGCGAALKTYMMYCSDVMAGARTYCPEMCQHALIALTSTEEGKQLMNCKCEDAYCRQSKARIDVCRPQVLKTAQNETMSCRLSQLICAADAPCANALEYYHRLCRSMFHGKKCTHKCLNSINILKKQEKANMLANCQCDGMESYDCPRIQDNMARLCFYKNKTHPTPQTVTTEKETAVTTPASANDVYAAANARHLPSLCTLFILTILSKNVFS